MSDEKKVKEKISFGDFMLYGGSKDERVQASADKAGHITLQIILALGALDILIRGAIMRRPWEEILVSMIVFFVGAIFYTIQWILRGITVMNTPGQKKAYSKFIISGGVLVTIISASTIVFNAYRFNDWSQLPLWIWLIPLGSGVFTAVLSFGLVKLTNYLAKLRIEKLAGKE